MTRICFAVEDGILLFLFAITGCEVLGLSSPCLSPFAKTVPNFPLLRWRAPLKTLRWMTDIPFTVASWGGTNL